MHDKTLIGLKHNVFSPSSNFNIEENLELNKIIFSEEKNNEYYKHKYAITKYISKH